MNILGIESSCDDTSVALLDYSDDGLTILAEKTASQIDVHKVYGGVVPEIAGRLHAEAITPVIEAVMSGHDKPDAIAVTSGPGLITGLLVGVEAAKTLSYLWDVPLIPTNHIAGHIHSVEVKSEKEKVKNSIVFPALALVVSGGHTEIIFMPEDGVYEKMGKTRDDAAGECFDKVGKLLGFDYPGGPKISLAAKDGNPAAIAFPRPMMDDPSLNFSFAGLKTAALYWLQNHTAKSSSYHLEPKTLQDFCASFEQAIIDVLIAKTLRAAETCTPKSILLVGGVSANKKLRETLQQRVAKQFPDAIFLTPEPKYCMDNGAMIAAAAYREAKQKHFTPWRAVVADPNWELGETHT